MPGRPFNSNVNLEVADFDAAYTHQNVAQIPAPLSPPAWVEAPLNGDGVGDINLNSSYYSGRTQFRIYSTHRDDISNQWVSWDSGESASLPAQLIVQYQ